MRRIYFLISVLVIAASSIFAQEIDVSYQRLEEKIDSLMTLEQTTVLEMYGKPTIKMYHRGAFKTLEDRKVHLKIMLTKLFDVNPFTLDSVYVENKDQIYNITDGKNLILSITQEEADILNLNASYLAEYYRSSIEKFYYEAHYYSILYKVAKFLLFLVIYLVGLFLLKLIYNKVKTMIKNSKKWVYWFIKNMSIFNVEDDYKELAKKDLNSVLKWIYIAILVIYTYISMPFMLNAFAFSRSLGDKMLGYIVKPLVSFWESSLNFLPTLIEIIIIIIIFRAFIRLINYFFEKIRIGKIQINGFYREWAKPTMNIIKIILYAFLLTIIFPLLPGSDSEVFKGVSVFLGLILSLGSTSVISNALSGIIMTYMRPFKLGDRIEVDNIIGVVVQKNLLVTRLKTPKNVIVTIPNSKILSGHSQNFTTAAEKSNLIIHSDITISYDVDWREVHRLLKNAANNVKDIVKQKGKEAFVLQKELGDIFVRYEINAYVSKADRYIEIQSELQKNILDQFNAAGIEIVTPRYTASRSGEPRTYTGKTISDRLNNPEPEN